MTLCVAWVRVGQGDEREELVFATDSRLRGGEAWDNGIKLFDLGRRDCLICFAGATQRAYPLILHASNAIRSHVEWSNPRFDLLDVLDLLCTMFTNLCDTIAEPPAGMTVEDIKGDAQFLFGGWSWRQQQFCLWRIHYEQSLQQFVHEAFHNLGGRTIAFLGDEQDTAEQFLMQEFEKAKKNKMSAPFDMEPLRVLVQMSRDEANIVVIGGALQVAKVYRSGHNEFFGMMWPSSMNGKTTMLGQYINRIDAPPIRFYDPDTALFTETLPGRLIEVDMSVFGDDAEFIRRCYPENTLQKYLKEADRDRLTRIFRGYAYGNFVFQCENASLLEPDAIDARKQLVDADGDRNEEDLSHDNSDDN